MIKRLSLLSFLVAAMVFTSALHAQSPSTFVFAHIFLTGNGLQAQCGTEMDQFTSFSYPSATTNCDILQNNQVIVANTCNAGNPTSDCPLVASTQPGSHYFTFAGNGLFLKFDDGTLGLCFDQGGHFTSGYYDPYHYGTPFGTPLPTITESGRIYSPNNGAVCWNNSPLGIAATSSFTLNTIQVTPNPVQVSVGQTRSFSSNITANWSLSGPGSITAGGTSATYRPPSTISSTQTAFLRACATDNSNNCDTATITLVPITVSISPGGSVPVIPGPGPTQQFTASVSPAGVSQGVTWKVISSTGSQPGTIDGNGLYTPPTNDKVVGTQFDTVQACSQLDPSRCDSIVVSVTQVTMSISGPATLLASTAATATYTTTINGTSSGDLTWTINPATGAGTITSNGSGTFTATYTPAAITTDTAITIQACLTVSPKICSTLSATVSPQVVIKSVSCTPACNGGETDTLKIDGTGFGSSTSQPNVSFTPPSCVILFNQTSWNPAPDMGPASFPILYQSTPCQVTLTSTGNATNSSASMIFAINPVTVTTTVSPTSASVIEGGSAAFSASATCKTAGGLNCTSVIPQTFNWFLTCPSALPNCGSISSGGFYTSTTSIPASITSTQTINGKASFAPNTSSFGSFIISLQPLSVTVSPPAATLAQGQTQQFSSSVLPIGANQGVTWSLSPPVGTISSSGLYTAPSSIPSDTTVTVIASSVIDSGRQGTAKVTLKAPDFSLTMSSSSLGPITAGSTVTDSVTIAPSFGFTGAVTLSVSGCPQNATCTFSPNPVTVNGLASSMLTVQTAPNTPGGTFQLTIKATSGGISHSSNPPVTLTVASFSIIAPPPSPPSQTIMASTCANYTITITDVNNFAGTVVLGVSGVPPSSTATFTPPSATLPPSFSSVLAVCTTAATPAGTYLLTITAASGVIAESAVVTLNVTNFSVTPTPASQNVTVSAPVNFTVAVAAQNGFNGTVGLSVSGCPQDATCTLNPTSLNGGGSSTLTVTLAGTTPLNTYTLNITATNGSLSQQTSVTVNVGPGLALTTANSGIAGRGTTVPISWVYTPGVGNSVSIYLYQENRLVQTIASGIAIDNSSSGTYTYNWSVPQNPQIGSGYTIQIVDSSGFQDQTSNYLIIR